jgi:hypothetical protein
MRRGVASVNSEQQKVKQEADRLYERYAKPLEAEHRGQYIALSPIGQVIVGATAYDVAQQATERFGRGNFLFKLGPRAVGRWRC